MPIPPTAPPGAAAPGAPAPASSRGLTASAAARRLATEGPNALPGGEARSAFAIVRETLREPMFLLLFSAGALYLAFGDLREALTLVAFMLATVGLTLFQEGRSERAIAALRDLSSPRARVVRDGLTQRIAGCDVVRGDRIELAEGDRVPADALVLAAQGLQVDESMLTGESVQVVKREATEREIAATDASIAAAPQAAAGAALAAGGEDTPWLHGGTLVVQGRATAWVTAIGHRTAIGRIGTALGGHGREPTPLQRQTARLVRILALLAFGLSLTLVLVQGLRQGDWLQAALAGIALAMALLPEEFPVVLTLFPAMGARRLSAAGVLTRRITSIETLGAATVLCTDKTGTLTENRMAVARLVAGGLALDATLDLGRDPPATLPEAFHEVVEMAILASAVDPFDPMEQAFHRLGERHLAGTEHLHPDWRLERSYALTPALRAMAHGWTDGSPGERVVAAKGAPEAVVDLCHLDASDQARIAAAVDALAQDGLRVLAVACGRFGGGEWPAEEHGLDFRFVGLVGLADPLRTEVPAAVAECLAAGIRVLMITGDYPVTAAAIGRQAGLAVDPGSQAGAAGPIQLLTGEDIATLDDAALQARLAEATVCARIAPEQKLRIVQALRARGEIVAMTGDGVNDAPALRAAHVGIAMGGRGTDVARECAALVLVRDDFASIVAGIRLGRRIHDNLRKAMGYILAVHVPIAGMALLPPLLDGPVLLLPMHIALLELIIDPACSLAFENEPAEPDTMRRPPRDVREPLFAGATIVASLLQGLCVLVAVLGGHALAQGMLAEPGARAFAFTTLVAGNLGLILANRSARAPWRSALVTPNRTLWAVVAVACALLGAAVYWPWAAGLLRFEALPPAALAQAVGIGGLGAVAAAIVGRWMGWHREAGMAARAVAAR